MSCNTPIKAYYDADKTLKIGVSDSFQQINLPCSKCIGCRNDFTKDWAVRCYHESQLHDYNCVLTLTFDEEHINEQRSLDKQDITKFIKRLRAYISRSEYLRDKFNYLYNKKISYFYCGEYGYKFSRPHYHIIIFGFDFPDKKFLKNSDSGDEMFTSEILQKLWPFGFATIGNMSMQSAMYVASYVTKYTSLSEKIHIYTDMNTGEFRQPEFGYASKKPAIGLSWFKKYNDEIVTHNSIIIKNQKYRIPRYYLKKLEELYPTKYERLKIKREEFLDNQEIDIRQCHNKQQISCYKLKNSGTLKSPDNIKRLLYLKSLIQRSTL